VAGAGLPGLLSGPGPLGSDPFGGFTPFGFDVPQGDPAAITAAAGRLLALAEALSDQERATRAAAGVARGGGAWGGSAADAYANYSGHVVSVCSTNAAACRMASSVLAGFAQDLATAQNATRAASADCERCQTEATLQQGNADQAAQDARIASGIATALPHPARAQFDLQASQAQQKQSTAQAAATAAAGALENAGRLGIQAAEHYLHAAQAASGRVASAGEGLRTAPALPSVGLVPVNIRPGDIALAAVIAAQLPATERFPDSAALQRLACGPISPGAAAQLAVDFGNKQHGWVSAHESIDGSVTGAIPGPVGEALGGAWDATKNAAGLVAAGVTDVATGHPEKIWHAVEGYGEFVVDHPIAAAKQAADWNDLSHGRVFKAIGEVGVEVLLAKGAGKLAVGGSKTVAVAFKSPATAEKFISMGATIAKAPHIGDAAPALAQLADKAVVKAAPHANEFVANALAKTIDLPEVPKISQVQTRPGVVVAHVPEPRATYRPPPPRVPARRYPRGR
jgi:hypothetical protein